MKNQLKYGLKAIKGYAPKWIINTSSIIALLITAKHFLITDLPLEAPELKTTVLKWMSYVLEVGQVCLAFAVIFTSKQITNDTK